jgi:hypothetical protein
MFRRLHHRNVTKGRKYPIKRDERGRSARSRAFRAFDAGMMSAEIAALVGITRRTVYRYRADWKKLPRNHQMDYRFAKWALSKESGLSEEAVSMIADALGVSEKRVVRRLEKPWGLKQLLMGQWPNPVEDRAHTLEEARLGYALWFLYFLEHTEMSDEDIVSWMRGWREVLQRMKRVTESRLRSAPGGNQPEREDRSSRKGESNES